MMKPLGLGYQKIDMSKLLHVVLFWKWWTDRVQDMWAFQL
jgi:hypothetical protein